MEFNNIKYKNVEGYNFKEFLIKPSVNDCILECSSINTENILAQNANINNINTTVLKNKKCRINRRKWTFKYKKIKY